MHTEAARRHAAPKSLIVVGVRRDGTEKPIAQYPGDAWKETTAFTLNLPLDGEFDDFVIRPSRSPLKPRDVEPRRPFRVVHLSSSSVVKAADDKTVAQLWGPRPFRHAVATVIVAGSFLWQKRAAA